MFVTIICSRYAWVTVDYAVTVESYHGDSSYMYTTHEVILRVYRYNTK